MFALSLAALLAVGVAMAAPERAASPVALATR
jgi:hypothetical protein